MSWQEIPFVRLVLPFIIGIVLSIWLNVALPWLWWILPMFLIALAFLRKNISYQYRWLFGIAMNFFMLMLGYQVCYEYDEMRSEKHFSQYLDGKSTLVVQLDEIPLSKKWTKAKAIVKNIHSVHTDGNLLLYIERDSLSEQLAYGDILVINGFPNKVEPPKNPNQFDYADYLHFNNIHHQVFIKADKWQLVEQSKGNPFFTFIFDLRKRGLLTLEKYLSPQSYSVGAALILGYREALDQEVSTAYADTGAIHVLAVSGLHVGILTMILKFLMRLLPKRIRTRKFKRSFEPCLIIGVLWLFACLTGASPSVLRAATMFSFVTIGFAMEKPSSIYNTLAISAFILLFKNPFLIKSVGFQLSYLAVLGIVYFQPKIYRSIQVPTRVGDYAWQLTSIAIAAQISTMPITLFFFHRFPVMFWLSGLVVIPTATAVLVLGILTLVLEILSPLLPLSSITGYILDWVIWLMNTAIFNIQNINTFKLDGIWLPISSMLLLFGVILSVIFIIEQKQFHQRKIRVRSLLIGLILILAMTILSSFSSLKQTNKQSVCVYSVYKNSIISFIDGHTVYRFQSPNIEQKTLAFSTEGHENALRIHQKYIFDIGTSISKPNIHSNENLIYFKGKTFLIIDNHFDLTMLSSKLEVDYVILTGNPRLFLKDLIEKVDFQEVIVDASNSNQKIGYWEKDAKEMNINIYNVADGAWFKLLE